MKLVIHTQYYPPEMGAPQARLSELAKYFASRGHKVTVLTAMPNYPQGSIFPGYGGLFCREEQDGVSVIRTLIYPTKSTSMFRRLVSYLSFVVSSLLVGIAVLPKADYLITESPPLFLSISGWLLAKVKGARWILNVSDLWPDSAKYIGMLEERSFSYRMLQKMAHFFYRKAWLVTGQSKEIISEIGHQVPQARLHHLSNGVDPREFHPQKRGEAIRQQYLRNGEAGFIYAGLHGLFQGLEQILLAAEKLKGESVRFLLFGDGPEKEALVKKASDLGLSNVDFYFPLSHRDISSLIASMDVAVAPLKKSIRGAVPSKIYEAMASGVPILLVANGEASEIIHRTGAGVAVAPGDIEGLVLSIRYLLSHAESCKEMGRYGRLAAETLFDRARIAEEFEALLLKEESLTGEG